MRVIHFDEAFDGGAWPGLYEGATAGVSWVGTAGLLGGLENLVGCAGTPLSASMRLGQVVRALGEHPGFWSRSYEADSLSTARELARLYDALTLAGWDGSGASPRLTELHRVFLDFSIAPNQAARLRTLATALRAASDVRAKVHVYAPLAQVPRLVRDVLTLVSSHTTTHATSPLPKVKDLQLVRPHGPLAAADQVAAALAASREVRTVIIGADPVLDAALHRHGLPTTGAASQPHDNALGELLPLLVSLAATPADPARAVELLTLPLTVLRRDVGRRLVRALQHWPAIGSPKWTQALEDALEALEDDAARDSVRERVATFLSPRVTGGAFPVAVLNTLAAELNTWLQGRLEHAKTDAERARFGAAVTQVKMFRELVELTRAQALSTAQVRRCLEQTRDGMPTPATFPPQAGFGVVATPGGIVGPVQRVVWWNFTRSSFVLPRRLPLDSTELAALAQQGIEVAGIAQVAQQQVARARRPLSLATDAAWLICPLHEPNGDDASPHPLWDEFGETTRTAAHVTTPRLPKPLVHTQRDVLPLPRAKGAWKTRAPIPLREKESPSSVEQFLGCDFAWSLSYVGGLYGGTTATLPTGEQLAGSLAHHVLLERVLRQAHATPEAAGQYALQVLNQEGPTLAAPLFLPGADAQLNLVRTATQRTAEVLTRLLKDGWHVAGTEQALEGTAFKTVFAGNADLILARRDERVVVDLKWSGHAYRLRLLEAGVAVQLAAYAQLLAQAGHAKTTVAYFIIRGDQLLSVDAPLLADELRPSTRALHAQTWALLEAAHAKKWPRVKKGLLQAPGARTEKLEESAISDDDELSLKPPCQFCDYQGLCGRLYGVEEVDDEGHD